MKSSTAYARRISADLFHVSYSDSRDADPEVSDAYLDLLVARGYRVQIEHGNYRGATSGQDTEVRDPATSAQARLKYRHGQ